MNQFYPCTKEGCRRKYKSEEGLRKHLLTCDGLQVFNCNQCIRKYRSEEGLRKHLLTCHNPDMISHNPNNNLYLNGSKVIVKSKMVYKCSSSGCIRRYGTKEALERHLEWHQNILITKLEKYTLKASKLESENVILKLQKSMLKRALENPENCIICLSEKVDIECVPCGHKNFCEKCITDYCEDKTKNCPLCQDKIEKYIKIDNR